MTQRLFEMVITAVGEVRDADGNLVGSEPVEARVTLTEEEAAKLHAQLSQQEDSP